MQHISVPSHPILNGSVAALLTFSALYSLTGIGDGIRVATIRADATHPVLLEFFAEVITPYNGTTPALAVGSVSPFTDFLAPADITEATAGFYPAANATKKYRIIADTNIYIKLNVGTAQVETATIVTANVTVAGNAAVTVTAAGVTGSPVVLAVPVTTADTTPSLVAAKIVAFMQTDATAAGIRAVYTVTGSGATIILTRLVPAANDATLNIAIATGTATGITAAPTSADTTAGVLGTANTAGNGLIYMRVTPLFPSPSGYLA